MEKVASENESGRSVLRWGLGTVGSSTSQYTHGMASHVSVPQVPGTPGNKQLFNNRVASVGQTKSSPPYTSHPATYLSYQQF